MYGKLIGEGGVEAFPLELCSGAVTMESPIKRRLLSVFSLGIIYYGILVGSNIPVHYAVQFKVRDSNFLAWVILSSVFLCYCLFCCQGGPNF